MGRWKTYQSYKMFIRISKLNVKFSILNVDSFQWLQGYEGIVNSDTTST